MAKTGVVLILLFTATAGRGETALSWDRHPKLSWSDFKGKPPPTQGEPSAETDTGFRLQLVCRSAKLDADVVAEFYPASSWVKPNRKLAALLRHEQGHFDITEIYARKIKKVIRDSGLGCEEEAGKRIIKPLDQEWEKAERQYDTDTRDGLDAAKQAAALRKIADELVQLQ
jgi:hypothetical protein